MLALYAILDKVKSMAYKFRYYIMAFCLGAGALIVALLFGRKSSEVVDAKAVKDVLMKDKKDILEEAIKNSENIVDKANNNIVYIEDKIKSKDKSIKETEKQIMEEDDVREISEGFKKAGL